MEIPEEIKERMMFYQVKQGNDRDWSIFENDLNKARNKGGFTWTYSIEGSSFWTKVLFEKDFSIFFEKYPKKVIKNSMNEILEVLEGVYENEELRQTIVPLFISDPGQGKSQIIEQFAKSKKVSLIEIITSQISPYEVSGLCMPDQDTKKMMYFDFDRIDSLKDGDILFFDELLQGNPVVLSACLTLIEQRRTISGKPLPKVMIVAAANPQAQVPITPAIKQRFVWYHIKFNETSWVEYMKNTYKMPRSIGYKLAKLIKNETFKSGENYFSPRSVVKAMNMIIHKVPTPYSSTILPALNELQTNKLTTPIQLDADTELAPNQMISWLELIQYQRSVKGVKYNPV